MPGSWSSWRDEWEGKYGIIYSEGNFTKIESQQGVCLQADSCRIIESCKNRLVKSHEHGVGGLSGPESREGFE
jgi:hypothetical protein